MITNESFMRIAEEVGSNSQATRLKVGAVLISPDRKILSTGYNGTPRGSTFPLENVKADITTNPWVIHAELNALLNATTSELTGCVLFVTHSPCVHCSALIVQKEIYKVVYKEVYRDTSGLDFLKAHDVIVQQL